MKRSRPWTAPARLEGIGVWLARLEMLEHHEVSKLRQLAQTFFQSAPKI